MSNLKDFYKSFGILTKNKKEIENELVYKLHQKPKRDKRKYMPSRKLFKSGMQQQGDILYLPNDQGYKYCLVVTDIANRTTDAEPIKSKSCETIIRAFKKIYKRDYVKPPKICIHFDQGTEFKGSTKTYFERMGVRVKYSLPYRHRQLANVEAKNRIIGKVLFMRMTSEELASGIKNHDWVDYLPNVIEVINKKLTKTDDKLKEEENNEFTKPVIIPPKYGDLLKVGQKVRTALDAPKNLIDGKRIYGNFRETDIRFEKEPKKINDIVFKPNCQPLYRVEKDTTLRTKAELQLVTKGERMPPKSEQHKEVVEKLLSRKKIKNRIYFRVKWRDLKKPTYELRSELMKDIPILIKQFEK